MDTIDTVTFTAADYRALPPEFPRVELLGGRFVEMTPAPSDRHQAVSAAIQFLLYQHVKIGGLGTVRDAPYDVYLDERNVVQPDLCVVLTANARRIKDEGLHGAPDLVVEVLSKSTAARDLAEKLEIYRAAGVPEYWVVDPDARAVHLYRLQDSRQRTSYKSGDALKSPLLPNFSPDVRRFFED
jgi:Uma2 family endonuclease